MKLLFALPLLLVLAAPAVAGADGEGNEDHEDHEDHERAREALRRGEVRPLADILADVAARFGGRVIEIEFEREHGRYIYEFEIAGEAGRVFEVHVDGETGEVLDGDRDSDPARLD